MNVFTEMSDCIYMYIMLFSVFSLPRLLTGLASRILLCSGVHLVLCSVPSFYNWEEDNMTDQPEESCGEPTQRSLLHYDFNCSYQLAQE
jgi:hypothetical protein